MNPRRVAFEVLAALESGPQRLEKILAQALSAHGQAAPRDRAFATSLVYAVLRHRLRLDHLLDQCTKGPLARLDAPVLAVLRLGAAELVVQGAPAFAAVHAAVELAKATPARRGQNLVNAVLRALARQLAAPAPDAAAASPGDEAGRLSLTYSHPRWIVGEMLASWPISEVEPWLAANQQDPPFTIRTNTLKITREELARELTARGLFVREHPLAPEGLVLGGVSGPASGVFGFAQGLWQGQDAAAQAVSHLLDIAPGQRVADLCAGAGGKTGHLAALMQNQGELVAVDPSAGRIRALEGNLARLGVTSCRALRGDARELGPEVGLFDRILVDAPCSGLGVAGRRPDLRWRRKPTDVAELAAKQTEILAAACSLLAPGGRLVYATCTFTRQENQEVVARALAGFPGLRLVQNWHSFPHRDQADAFSAAVLARN
ncbi:MAG: 16S rRNA (cytosine(967)-C(5))-methyltransferase RsmB [Deltaproteobacteria bacterium]|nr:16S rRNA (cytosine(967)-C(5))-methyltransferase RsmB [Deltaproteobacteria bacterium]